MQTRSTFLLLLSFLFVNQLNLIRTTSIGETVPQNHHKFPYPKYYGKVITEILQKLHVNSFVGQVLLPGESLSDPKDVSIFAELNVPLVVFGDHKSVSLQETRRKQLQSNKFSSSYYAHIDIDINEYKNKYWKTWRRLYSDLLQQNTEETNSDPIRTFMERIYLRDFFIFHESILKSGNDLTHGQNRPNDFSIYPKNSIRIIQTRFPNVSMSYGFQEKCEYGPSKMEVSPSKSPVFLEFFGNRESISENENVQMSTVCANYLENTENEVSIECPSCFPKELAYFQRKETCNNLKINSKRSFVGCLLSEVVEKLNSTFKVSLKSSGMSDLSLVSRKGSSIVKRSQSYSFSPQMMFRSSLIFIAKRKMHNWDSILKPFTLVSWVGIFAAYSIAAIVFAIIKIVSLNNPDQSWYDYMVQQLLEIVNDDRNDKKKMSIIKSDEENVNLELFTKSEDLKISLSSNEEESSSDNANERGKTSKAVLHATIRMVSFVLVAAYEGKLYNTITFPKSRFISTFDELLSGDKYSVKISREAEQTDLLYNLRSQSMHNSSNVRNASSVIMESVNIEDCINWVESSTNHACIGYDFEFRNLQKGQQFEKIIAKSKEKITRFGFGFNSGAGTRRAYPALQISRWVLEAGIFQFWTMAENIFNEAVVPNRLSKSRVLTIKDYLGLFVVYIILLILASLSFTCEYFYHKIAKRKISLKGVTDCWQNLKHLCSNSGSKVRNFFKVVKRSFCQMNKNIAKTGKTKMTKYFKLLNSTKRVF